VSPSFNRAWTPSEQKKLEKLLEVYPDESVASHRWEKIARALGNRTPKQVAIRVQKYFIKLAKAGLPVPGKSPNLEYYTKKRNQSKNNNKNDDNPNKVTIHTGDIDYYRPPPIMMPDKIDTSKENPIKPIMYNYDKNEIVHFGYKCSVCNSEPITGVRWKCIDCPLYNPVDLCEKCHSGIISIKESQHNDQHRLEAIANPEVPYIDADYKKYDPSLDISHMIYVDPNFMPL